MAVTDPLTETEHDTLTQRIHGEVHGPRDDGYDEARSIWN